VHAAPPTRTGHATDHAVWLEDTMRDIPLQRPFGPAAEPARSATEVADHG